MKLVATMPVRNEAWCLGLSARVALRWCDELVIGDHLSTDVTPDILSDLRREFPERITTIKAVDSEWTEMKHRQLLLEVARNRKATHISIVDADEVLTGNLLNQIPSLPVGTILQLPGVNLRGDLNRMHVGGTWGSSWFSLAFQDDARLHWSADHRGGYDHHHREPWGMHLGLHKPVARGNGGVFHLQMVNERRLKAKHAWYKLSERIRWPQKPVAEIDRLYNLAIYNGPQKVEKPQFGTGIVPSSWWGPYADLMQFLHLDMEPWQEAECRRLIDRHGREAFAGLDLFGVA